MAKSVAAAAAFLRQLYHAVTPDWLRYLLHIHFAAERYPIEGP